MKTNKRVQYLTLILLLFWPLNIQGQVLPQAQSSVTALPKYKVIRVVEGSIIVILKNGKETNLRLIGIDPTSLNISQAQGFLTKSILGKLVYLQQDSQLHESPDGLPCFYIYRVADQLFINLEMIKQGIKIANVERPFDYQKMFRAEEYEARIEGRGLWESYAGEGSVRRSSNSEDEFISRNSSQRHRGSKSVSEETEVKAGEQVYLNLAGQNSVPVATYEVDLDKFLKAQHAGDIYAASELVGDLFLVTPYTLALIIDGSSSNIFGEKMSILKVRILEGKYKGSSGWVRKTWVRN